MAYYEVEPWGSQLDGVRMAHNTSAVFNAGLMNANPKRYNSNRSKPKDFFIGITETPKKRPTWQQLKRKFLSCIPPSMLKRVEKDDSRKLNS